MVPGALVTLYLLVLTVAAFFGDRHGPPEAGRRRRFAILVPAHNEESVISRLLHSVHTLDYPERLVDVYVVADNCSDRTAAQASALGALVYERADPGRRGKGHALHWLLQQLAERQWDYDALVVVDADCQLSRNFLTRMDARLAAGQVVIQAYYTVLNAEGISAASLRQAALAAVHYLRPLGRTALGLSVGLKGTGMCFATSVLAKRGWQWYGLAEDVELHLALSREGYRVRFAPEAIVAGEMPTTLAQAKTQNERWERGRLHLLRGPALGLIARGVRRRDLRQVDAALEQLIPPLSVSFAAGAVCLAASLALAATPLILAATVILAGQIVYLLAALVAAHAPLNAYLALVQAPFYVIWKVGLYGRSLFNTETGPWVRTSRAAGSPEAAAHE
jgi:cellulose synthase/poly-beta-1,6-N-acetylglucosamine synthase-like glycosyltransferase